MPCQARCGSSSYKSGTFGWGHAGGRAVQRQASWAQNSIPSDGKRITSSSPSFSSTFNRRVPRRSGKKLSFKYASRSCRLQRIGAFRPPNRTFIIITPGNVFTWYCTYYLVDLICCAPLLCLRRSTTVPLTAVARGCVKYPWCTKVPHNSINQGKHAATYLVYSSMVIGPYLIAVNALSFCMHAEDKAVSTGLLPFLRRIPGEFFRNRWCVFFDARRPSSGRSHLCCLSWCDQRPCAGLV